MDVTVIEQYTQPIPNLPPQPPRDTAAVDHTVIIAQLRAQLDLQDRELRRLASDLQALREWIARRG